MGFNGVLMGVFQVTANNSISLAQFDYAVKFEEEYREAIASGGSVQKLSNCFLFINQNCFQISLSLF